MATVLANPNWPVTGFDVDFQSGPPFVPSNLRLSIDAAYRRLTVRQWNTDRGRQYELDQVSAGQLTVNVHDPLENLNSENPASPYNLSGNLIIPYRCIQVWAMWPNQPGSGNINNSKVGASFDPSFENGLGGWTRVGGTTTFVQSTAQHQDGTKALLVTQSAAGSGFGVTNAFPTAPLLTYTLSAYVFPTAGCAVTLSVVDAGGVTHSVSSTTTSAWQRLTVTWNCVDTTEDVTIYGTGTATPTFYVDAVMLEFGAATNAYVATGPALYPQYTGYVERWPTTYDMAGTRATHELAGVDALAILSRTEITQTYAATVKADAPKVYVPLNNAKPATSGGALSTGSETAVIGTSNISGDPLYIISATGAMSWAGDQHPDGTPALVLTQQNANNPPIPGGSNQDTYMDVLNGPGLSFDTVAGGVMEVWARPVSGGFMLAGMMRGPAGTATNYSLTIPQIIIERYPTGGIIFAYDYDGAHFAAVSATAANGIDNQWHYYAITIKNGQMFVMVDGAESGAVTVTTPGRIGFNILSHISVNTGFGDPNAQIAVGRWAVYLTDIGFSQRLAHYNRGSGYINEKSGARVVRLLAQYWAGGYSVANGYLAMAPDFGYDGRVMLDVLQEIQESERGLVYADTMGDVVFEDRTSRYLNQTPLWVFGENPVAASPVEYPYTQYVPDKDPTYTFSQANLSRPNNSNFAPVINAATQAKFGQRILSQTVQCNTDFDLTQAGIFYTTRYANTKQRISMLELDPAANPALWPVVLSLEISQLVKVTRRNAGVTVTNNYYIERIAHKVDAEAGSWKITVQLSPQFVSSAWVLGDATYGVLGTTTAPVY